MFAHLQSQYRKLKATLYATRACARQGRSSDNLYLWVFIVDKMLGTEFSTYETLLYV